MTRSLAMKYRRLLRPIADQIPIDVISASPTGACGQLFAEIQEREVVHHDHARRMTALPLKRLILKMFGCTNRWDRIKQRVEPAD